MKATKIFFMFGICVFMFCSNFILKAQECDCSTSIQSQSKYCECVCELESDIAITNRGDTADVLRRWIDSECHKKIAEEIENVKQELAKWESLKEDYEKFQNGMMKYMMNYMKSSIPKYKKNTTIKPK